ncbi:GNAT family N-acetyltransferase [Paenibacillus sp. 8b26]|uniref:GNAT family N-acetyltransferase n=1 Tax=Paenibacillus sp. 8b26 TaxID=3424133 RepID=UPI003D64E808
MQEVIKAGDLYLWIVKNTPVSMANIAHRSPRHAQINAVYTPTNYRKKGFASAIVANLCSILESEHLVPILYADLKNPTSNQVYKNIGFIEGGTITDIQFE